MHKQDVGLHLINTFQQICQLHVHFVECEAGQTQIQSLAHGPWSLVPGPTPGPRHLVHGPCYPVPGPVPGPRHLVLGPWSLDMLLGPAKPATNGTISTSWKKLHVECSKTDEACCPPASWCCNSAHLGPVGLVRPPGDTSGTAAAAVTVWARSGLRVQRHQQSDEPRRDGEHDET